ncbi:MAG: hypothetical protein VB092_01430 [Oscillospiraceae bacterium]|nr:hypothetical protein [Oscillospiraceae bacterium]
MPDFLSHSIFADELLAGEFPRAELCRTHGNLFRLGAQGPDLFYYCAALREHARFTQLADALHAEGAEAPVLRLLREKLAAPAPDAPEIAYLMGWLAHLQLDAAAHPYICERARMLADALHMPESCAHVMFESTIEARELLEKRGIEPRRFDYRRDLPHGTKEGMLVARLCGEICAASSLCAPAPAPARLAAAIAQLPALFAVLFDRCGVVKAVLDLKYNLTRRDFEARWHIKRPYRPAFAASILPGGEYAHYLSLAARGKDRWLTLARAL